MPKSVLPSNKAFTCEILAKIFDLCPKRLRNLCSTGQIPFVKRVGRIWLVSRRGAQFLEGWLRRDPSLPRFKLRATAAKLDPAAAARQPELPPDNSLTDPEVRAIRRSSKPLAGLANKYGRTKSSISKIKTGERYADVV